MTRKIVFADFLRLFFLVVFLISSHGLATLAWATEGNASSAKSLSQHSHQCGPDCGHSSHDHTSENASPAHDHDHSLCSDEHHADHAGHECKLDHADHSDHAGHECKLEHADHADHPDHPDHADHAGHIHQHEHQHGHQHHGHVCTVCGGAHDESVHQKELERTKFETIDVKYSILKNRALGTVVIAIILALLAIIFKVKG